MDQRDPHFWPWLIEWLNGAAPMAMSGIAAIVLTVLRFIYEGKSGFRPMLCESAMCGVIAVVVMSGVVAFGFPESAATFVGGAVGFLGVEKVRTIASHWLGRKVP